jgi:hypothetical protein
VSDDHALPRPGRGVRGRARSPAARAGPPARPRAVPAQRDAGIGRHRVPRLRRGRPRPSCSGASRR